MRKLEPALDYNGTVTVTAGDFPNLYLAMIYSASWNTLRKLLFDHSQLLTAACGPANLMQCVMTLLKTPTPDRPLDVVCTQKVLELVLACYPEPLACVQSAEFPDLAKALLSYRHKDRPYTKAARLMNIVLRFVASLEPEEGLAAISSHLAPKLCQHFNGLCNGKNMLNNYEHSLQAVFPVFDCLLEGLDPVHGEMLLAPLATRLHGLSDGEVVTYLSTWASGRNPIVVELLSTRAVVAVQQLAASGGFQEDGACVPPAEVIVDEE